ncbi:hypothetical protein [Methylocystis hirsuta]|uniref:hypothetical protein n=1 Tax=Methylocystis hirsuta TaxID=369798 RepID=UPI0014758829|nr:hypothetical protein [Methylocystis hirsuta]
MRAPDDSARYSTIHKDRGSFVVPHNHADYEAARATLSSANRSILLDWRVRFER